MVQVFEYQTIDSDALKAELENCGQVNIEIPLKHSEAMIALIRLTQQARSSSNFDPFSRCYLMVYGAILPFWVTIFHFRINEIFSTLVGCHYYEWEQLPSGAYLFHFGDLQSA